MNASGSRFFEPAPGYFVSSVNVDENGIRRYVEYQGRKDSDQLQMKL
jgi:hypothetical protein